MYQNSPNKYSELVVQFEIYFIPWHHENYSNGCGETFSGGFAC